MRKISITEALNELKLYDSKIFKAIENANLVGAAKKSSDKVGVFTKETFEKNAKSAYQSVTDLISNRNALKSVIVKSNALTTVTVAGKSMSVAEVIEKKKSIAYDETFLCELKEQYSAATNTVLKENKRVDNKIDELLAALVGKDTDKKLSSEDQENVEGPYRKKNEFELVDPLNIFSKIEQYETEIEAFKAGCDTALAVINATTFIEIDF